MTPPATTQAGRNRAARATTTPARDGRQGDGRQGNGRQSNGHQGNGHQRNAIPRPVRAATAIPRRVSGPVRGAAPARAKPTRPRPPAPQRPRRSTTQQPRRPAPRRSTRQQHKQPRPAGLLAAALAAVRGMPDHRWLDRLVRGRAWIPVLGVLLAGIVATQVEVLKLGASTGRWVERTAALSGSNQALQASVARLSDDQRIERLAAGMGMVMPAPTAITFLRRPGPGEVRSALARIRPPDSAQFRAALPPNGTTPLLGVTSTAAGSQRSAGG